jgi:hypothetical protein
VFSPTKHISRISMSCALSKSSVILVTAVLILLGASASAQVVQVVQGTITDQATGQPIAGAAVTLYGPSLITVNTDSNGNYAVTGQQWPYTGSAEMWIVAPGYFTPVLSVNITTPFPVVLNRALITGGTLIRGTVTDATSGLAVANASVLFSSGAFYPGASTRAVQTDTAGNYMVDSSQFNESVATSGAQVSVTVNSSPGYFQQNIAVTANAPFPVTQDFGLVRTGTTETITIQTSPTALNISVDGTSYVAPQTFTWVAGNPHIITAASPQPVSSASQNLFTVWSNGGPISQTIVTPASNATYTANFVTQYQLTTVMSPAGAGTVTSGGWFNAGANVLIQATASPGFQFAGFSGDLIGTTNPQVLNMNGPKLVTANFSVPTSIAVGSSLNPSVLGQSVTFTAIVTPQFGTIVPTGTVAFWDGAVMLGSSTLNGNGQATLSVSTLAQGSHSISANYSGDATYSKSNSGVLNQIVVVTPPGAALYGVVTDRSTNQPIAGVKVYVNCGQNSCFQTTTDGNGVYSLTGAQVGNQTSAFLYFQGTGYYVNTAQVTITSAPTTANITLLPGGTIIQGTVRDANTQAGIVGATLSFAISDGNFLNGLGPLPQTGSGGAYVVDSSKFLEAEATAGGFDVTLVSLTATAYFNTTAPAFHATPPFPITQNFTMNPNGLTSTIVVTTVPPGLSFSVDGTGYNTQQTFTWVPGNEHTIAATSPQSGGTGIQSVFLNWSNNGPVSQTIVVPTASTTYSALFKTQYSLTTSANPAAGGTITAGGWVDAGSVVTMTATANAGYHFTGFSGALNGTTNPQNLTVTAPASVTANFGPTTQPPAISSASTSAFTVGLAGSFNVIATGIPSPTLSESGALPAGITFNPSTGVLSGTPAAGTAGTYSITFMASNGVSPNAVQNFSLVVHLPSVALLTLNPTSVVGSTTNSIATITLNAPAVGTVAQRTVTLSSSNTSAATLSATVTVAAGATSANVTVTSQAVASTTTATITASLNGGSQNAVLTVTPLPQLVSVTLNPTNVPGGVTNSVGRVTLNAPAVGTAAQRTVTLSSDNTAAATVPATVTVATGATTANFTVTSLTVATTATANITATFNSGSQSAPLTVTPRAGVVSLTLNPASVLGGSGNSVVTVTLNAPAAGTTAQRTVTLSSSNTAAATVPASVVVAVGATTTTFTVTSHVVSAVALPQITATLNGSASATLTVNPLLVMSIVLNPTSVVGGVTNSTATITLNGVAAGTVAQRTVTLTSSNTAAATVPATIVVPTGATTATFTVTSHAVTTVTPSDISASIHGGTQTATLSITP